LATKCAVKQKSVFFRQKNLRGGRNVQNYNVEGSERQKYFRMIRTLKVKKIRTSKVSFQRSDFWRSDQADDYCHFQHSDQLTFLSLLTFWSILKILSTFWSFSNFCVSFWLLTLWFLTFWPFPTNLCIKKCIKQYV